MQYRRELDGLRAFAIIPVLIFHADERLLNGGFIGVDVFFVISGYLICSIIQSDLERGFFSFQQFYVRRAKRILPALFLVMLACVPLTWLLLTPDDMKGLSESLSATALFASNIYFWTKIGYFDSATELKPLIHTWSLAVEEQFYLLFPLLMLASWRLATSWKYALFGGILIASLLSAHFGNRIDPSASFFLLHARAWELLAGALIALSMKASPRENSGSAVYALLSTVGLALIVESAFRFDKSTPWPSLQTLQPVVGAALVIAFAAPNNLTGRLLGSRGLVGIGLISYSLYLWHQPLLAMAKYHSNGHLTPASIGLVGGVTLLLSVATWRFVEVPIKLSTPHPPKVFTLVAFAVLAFAGLALAGRKSNGFERLRLPEAKQEFFRQLESRRFHRCFTDVAIKEFRPVSTVDLCVIGNSAAKPSFIVHGDSHAISLALGFHIAAEAAGKSGLLLATSACPPLTGASPVGEGRIAKLCRSANDLIPRIASENSIRQVFLVGRWT